MAGGVIGTAWDPTKIGLQSYAYDCWYSIEFEDNSMEIPEDGQELLRTRWSHYFDDWQNDIDDNGLELEDDNFFIETKAASKEETAKTVNNEGKAETGNNAANLATAGASVATSTVAIAGGATGAIAGGVLFVVGATLALATGILYEATKPNKKAHEALMQLKTLMEKSNTLITNEQQESDAVGEEATTKASELEDEKASREAEILKKVALLIAARLVQSDLQKRMNAGEPITKADLAKFELAGEQIDLLDLEVMSMKAELQEIKDAKSSEIEALNLEFEKSIANIATAMGEHDFAAGFDESTRNLCITEAATQSLNVVAGIISGTAATIAGAVPFGWWALAFAAMGFAGAGMSAHGVVQQSKFAIDIKDEVNVRENLNTSIGTSMKVIDENVGRVDSNLTLVGGISLEGAEQFSEAAQESAGMSIEVTKEPAPSNNPFAPTDDSEPKKVKNSTNPFV